MNPLSPHEVRFDDWCDYIEPVQSNSLLFFGIGFISILVLLTVAWYLLRRRNKKKIFTFQDYCEQLETASEPLQGYGAALTVIRSVVGAHSCTEQELYEQVLHYCAQRDLKEYQLICKNIVDNAKLMKYAQRVVAHEQFIIDKNNLLTSSKKIYYSAQPTKTL